MNSKAKRSRVLAASFLLPAGLMTLVFALGGICPFGSRSLGVLDMSQQYAAFLYSLRDVLAGRASALYMPGMALGGNMMGVITYYLASPLDVLTCLFPRERMLEAVSALYILRVGLCGLTMAVYCGQRRGYGWRILIPAAAYGMTGYMCAYAINYLWQDCVILLPVVALGISRLAEGRGRWTYILSLAAALVCNFYTGYILCLFSVLFFLAELLAGTRPARGGVPGRLGAFALASLAAGALAAGALLPAAMSLMGGKAGLGLEAFTLTAKFDPRALFSKLFPGAFNYEELTPVGLPNIFCGTVTAGLAGMYLLNRTAPLRRRLAMAGLTAVIGLSFLISAADLVWHGMNVPTWYNYRYSFLFSFLLIAGADGALAGLRQGARPWHLLLIPALTALSAALAFIGRTYPFIDASVVPGTVALSAACAGALYLILRPGQGRHAAAVAAALLVVLHAAELGQNAAETFSQLTASSADPAQWAAYVTDKAAALAYADTDGQLIRTESPDSFAMDRCESMLFGYDGLTHYGSTLPQKNLDFLARLGLNRYKDLFALYGPGVTAAADSFLSVGFVTAADMTKPYEALGSAGAYTTWRDPWALPLGWTADAAMARPVEGADCFTYLDGLFAAAAPEVGRAIFTAGTVLSLDTEALADAGGGRYELADGASSGSVTYTVEAAADGPLYGQFHLEDFPGVTVFVNDRFCALYGTAQMNGSLYLGDFAAGDRVTVRLQAGSAMTLTGAAFATESAQALAAYREAIAPGDCPLTKLSGSHYTGRFTTGEGDELLVLTLPWDGAWQISLDGERVQPEQIQDCLTAIPVSPGSHTLDMRYVSPGLIPGGCISALAAAVCIGTALRQRRKKDRTA